MENKQSAGVWVKASEPPKEDGFYITIMRDGSVAMTRFDPCRGLWLNFHHKTSVVYWLDESKPQQQMYSEDEVKSTLISSTHGFTDFEQAFIECKERIGWKDLLYFTLKLIKHYQPKDTNYTIQSVFKDEIVKTKP